MGKANNKGGPTHLQSRVSYLYQAATYFAGLSSTAQSKYVESGTPIPDGVNSGRNAQDGRDRSSSFTPIHAADGHTDNASDTTKAASIWPEGNTTVKDESSVRVMLSHIKGIAKKGQVRVPPSVKHAVCKRCDNLLINGQNSIRQTKNQSREGKKPWADVLVITCHSCGTAKRYPIGAKRQPGRKDRSGKAEYRVLRTPRNLGPKM